MSLKSLSREEVLIVVDIWIVEKLLGCCNDAVSEPSAVNVDRCSLERLARWFFRDYRAIFIGKTMVSRRRNLIITYIDDLSDITTIVFSLLPLSISYCALLSLTSSLRK